ncbi:unnamed protein product [Fusarium venenatum]|uniref:Uncharacterized protein n=1 Tax=Fusarium venenatum TaxID=56646 RepID=A0A2L2TSU5_9HYPO|nr:uncharacterized protein FVRRES_07461 [Fusarium venenatum]CEI63025.1 unnamed protein product [Fusarium venenatum]
MAYIQHLPCELLLEIMIYCNSDVLSFARFGDVDLPSFALAGHLRHMRLQTGFYTLSSFVVEGWIEPLLDQNTEGSKPPCFHKFSLAALCVMWEVGGDEKKICDTYQQQASATTTRGPDAEPTSEELQLTRLSTDLTREEQRLFMDAAFNFESTGPISSISLKHWDLVSAVARRLKSIHGNVRQRWSWDSGSDEKFYDPWHLESKEWVYFSSELPPKLRNIGQNIWEDMWNREDPRRRPNHNMMPYRVNPSDEGQ